MQKNIRRGWWKYWGRGDGNCEGEILGKGGNIGGGGLKYWRKGLEIGEGKILEDSMEIGRGKYWIRGGEILKKGVEILVTGRIRGGEKYWWDILVEGWKLGCIFGGEGEGKIGRERNVSGGGGYC